jgi:hypothetical protein
MTPKILVLETPACAHPVPSPESTNLFLDLQIEGLSEAFYKNTNPFVKGFCLVRLFFLRLLLLGRLWFFVVRRFDLLHAAAALENNPFIHDHRWSLDVSKDFSRRVDFNLLDGEEIASNLPAHHQMGDLNVGLDDGVIAHNQGAVRQDLSFETTVDPDRSGKRELSLKLRILSQKGVDFVPSFHVLISGQ